MRVSKIKMGTQGDIDSVQIFLSDGLNEHILKMVGSRKLNQ